MALPRLMSNRARFPRFPVSKFTERVAQWIHTSLFTPPSLKNVETARNLSGDADGVPFLMQPALPRDAHRRRFHLESRRPRGPGFPVSLIFIIANTRLALKGPILGLAEAGPVLDLSRERRPTHVVSKGASNGPTPPPRPPYSSSHPLPVLLPSAATHPVSRATRSLLPIFRSPLSNVP